VRVYRTSDGATVAGGLMHGRHVDDIEIVPATRMLDAGGAVKLGSGKKRQICRPLIGT
jgi:hypothetical protein